MIHFLKRSGLVLFVLVSVSVPPKLVDALFGLPEAPSVRIMGIKKVEFYPDAGDNKKVIRHRILGTIFENKTDIQIRLFDEFNDQNKTHSNLSLTVRAIDLDHRTDLVGGYKIWEGPVQFQGTQLIENENKKRSSRMIQGQGQLFVSDSPHHTHQFNSLSIDVPADPKTGRRSTSYKILLDARFPS